MGHAGYDAQNSQQNRYNDQGIGIGFKLLRHLPREVIFRRHTGY